MPAQKSSSALGVGLGLGLLFVPVVNIPVHHFLKRRLIANSIVTTGTSIGGVIWPIMLNKLFNNPSIGFAWGVQYSSFILLHLLLVANFLMKTRLPNRWQQEAAGIITPKPLLKVLLSNTPYICSLSQGKPTSQSMLLTKFHLSLLQHNPDRLWSIFPL
jgi:MCP family monocarboxylic acid transporter-like MFS transporter 10